MAKTVFMDRKIKGATDIVRRKRYIFCKTHELPRGLKTYDMSGQPVIWPPDKSLLVEIR